MSACSLKVLVPDELAPRLEAIYPLAMDAARRMLKHRELSSTKYYHELSSFISKGLIRKYQRNPKCLQILNLVLPICGDKGSVIKLESNGVRIPALFKKAVLPVRFHHPITGFIRSAEFFRRKGKWFCTLCYNTVDAQPIKADGCIGVDRNSVGNVAVFADPQNGTVRKLGICPARTKAVMRGRRKNLQKAGKFRLLSKLRRKQSRRMTHENHRASKSVVDYAAKHCRAVAIENLDGVRAPGSKIRRYSDRNQWAFAQLGTFIRYKCALRGVPLIEVDPAYTSQTCSRCGNRHKPNGKVFSCGSCGRTAHRDVNASFVIAKRGLACIGGSSGIQNVIPLRPIGGPQAEKVGAKAGAQNDQNPAHKTAGASRPRKPLHITNESKGTMNQTKRIVIIEGDAFDADAIVAIVKTEVVGEFSVFIEDMDAGFDYGNDDDIASDKAMGVAVDAWRAAVGDIISIPTAEPLPDQPAAEPEGGMLRFWSDQKGRYYETYGGSEVFWDSLGRFIWNEGPPRRKNPLGPGASPILKVYVDGAGKVIDPQPI